MLRVLFSCHTLYQLMVAVNLRMTVYAGYDADLIVSDHTPGMAAIFERLEREPAFDKVYYARTNAVENSKKIGDRLQKLWWVFSCRRTARYIHGLQLADMPLYDAFCFWNLGLQHFQLYALLYCKNPAVEVSLMEEGYASYLEAPARPVLEKLMALENRRARVPNLLKNISKIFVFEPRLCSRDFPFPVVAMPKLESGEVQASINRIFGFNGLPEEYKKSVILLEDMRLENGIVGDEEVFGQIIDAVGPEFFVVKPHPRNLGGGVGMRGDVCVARTGQIPFEVICMNADMRTKVFLSVSSGSAILPSILFAEKPPVIFLYLCLPQKPRGVQGRFEKFVEAYRAVFPDNIWVPNDTAEAQKLLLEMLKKIMDTGGMV